MGKLLEVYKEYKEANEKYQKLRKDLFKEPEMKAHELAVDFNIYELKRQVESLKERHKKKARALYNTIYNEEPVVKDLERFLAIADELMECDGIMDPEEETILRVTRDLVWAHKTAFRGTRDEYDQKSLLEEKV